MPKNTRDMFDTFERIAVKKERRRARGERSPESPENPGAPPYLPGATEAATPPTSYPYPVSTAPVTYPYQVVYQQPAYQLYERPTREVYERPAREVYGQYDDLYYASPGPSHAADPVSNVTQAMAQMTTTAPVTGTYPVQSYATGFSQDQRLQPWSGAPSGEDNVEQMPEVAPQQPELRVGQQLKLRDGKQDLMYTVIGPGKIMAPQRRAGDTPQVYRLTEESRSVNPGGSGKREIYSLTTASRVRKEIYVDENSEIVKVERGAKNVGKGGSNQKASLEFLDENTVESSHPAMGKSLWKHFGEFYGGERAFSLVTSEGVIHRPGSRTFKKEKDGKLSYRKVPSAYDLTGDFKIPSGSGYRVYGAPLQRLARPPYDQSHAESASRKRAKSQSHERE